jgi:hypothetical protein
VGSNNPIKGWIIEITTRPPVAASSSSSRSSLSWLRFETLYLFMIFYCVSEPRRRADVCCFRSMWKTSFNATDGVNLWRRRGNRNARGGPSGDLIKVVLGQFPVSRFAHLLARCTSVVCGGLMLAHKLFSVSAR